MTTFDLTEAPPAEAVDPGFTTDTVAAGPAQGEARPSEEEARDKSPEYRTIRIPKLPFLRIAGATLMAIGLLIVMFVVYLFAFTPLTASRNQQRLAASLSGQPLSLFRLVGGHLPPEGEPVAILSIPSIGVHQVVVQGSSAADLMNGPGLMPGTALPGTPGNAVIAGRRVTFGAPFGEIGQLRHRAPITVVDGAGTFTYRVSRVFVLTSGQRDVITPSADNLLTLVTANGSIAPNGRLVVRARLVGTPVAVPGQVVAVPTYESGLSGDPVAGGMAALWSILLVLALVLAVVAAWRWRRPLLVYLLAAPVVVACGLLACESVARALPATY